MLGSNCNSSLDSRWFAVWTRSRLEKNAASRLEGLGIAHFLPLRSELRRWSDRKQVVETPLFAGYLFVRINLQLEKLQVLKTPGIAGLVGNLKGPIPIPDQQIESVRAVVNRRVECKVESLLEEGEKVRVVRGLLAGIEGRLIRGNSPARLAISIDLLHKSMLVEVSRQDVEPLNQSAA